MKSKLIATLIAGGMLAGSAFAGPEYLLAVNFGAPVVPVAPAVGRLWAPGPGYVWVMASTRTNWWTPDLDRGYWRAPVFAPRMIAASLERRFDRDDRRFDRDHDRRFDRGFRVKVNRAGAESLSSSGAGENPAPLLFPTCLSMSAVEYDAAFTAWISGAGDSS